MQTSLSLVTSAAVALLAACGDGTPALESGVSGVAASGSTSSGASGVGGAAGSGGSSGEGGAKPSTDLDGDGLDDAWEQMIAESYLPFLSIAPDDGCSLGGVVFRVYPHPKDATLLHIIYDHLFQTDCGLSGHVGDNEVFGATIDPAVPPPAGILALKAVTHQGTACEKTTECGSCSGLPACATTTKNGVPGWPVAFSSKDKHATYVEKGECNFLACFDSCSLADEELPTPLVNAGEPAAHLTEDLTTNGFITEANGWKEKDLFNFNPWDPAKEFGAAGNIADDLQDPAFEPSICK